MKNIKTKLAAIIMTGFLMAGTTFGQKGIIISDVKGEQPCVQTDKGILMSDYTGIIITGLSGILISDYTGIIITGLADTKSRCGN